MTTRLGATSFVNQNRDPDEDYLADGISEDIITALAKHRWLTVVARNPAFAFRNSSERIRAVGQKLEADYVVTGTVRKAGARFRITVQVVEAATEHSVWSERFDRNMTDVFELQERSRTSSQRGSKRSLGLPRNARP